MKTWDEKKVIRWIQQRDPSLFDDDDVETFLNADIIGTVFLDLNYDFLRKECGLPLGISRQVILYMDQVIQQEEGGS